MADWEFEEISPAHVEQELTQRDQFNNDDVGLTEALVREVSQNSLDAGNGDGPVKLRFQVRTLDPKSGGELRKLFSSLKPHLQASGIDSTPIDATSTRILVIEDFNTVGLTGGYEELDDGNFRNFWRLLGRSAKGGSSGGRWGLGKLVFSSSSQIRAFFGLTIRQSDSMPLLMGQAVLSNHTIGDARYDPYGFWFEGRGAKGIQLPVTDPATISVMQALFGLTRTTQTGFSIAIPYISDGVTEDGIIRSVLTNFYFPILANHLVVEVGSEVINRETFHKVAIARSGADGMPFPFVEKVSAKLLQAPDVMASRPIGSGPLDQNCFGAEDLEAMKQRFAGGKMIHVRLPVRLRSKSGDDVVSHMDLFLMPLPENERPFALFARGPIVLIGERRYFAGLPAWGALVASEERIAAFLGDAENPAHTLWNSKAEKLAARWRSPGPTLSNVRNSLKQLYGLVAERIETALPDALIDFFSLAAAAQPGKEKKKRVKPPIPPAPREKSITIRPKKCGFEIAAGPGAAKWKYPRMIRVRAAYDIVGGNPFKRYHPFDFDFRKGEIDLTPEDAEVTAHSGNILALKVTGPSFRLEAHGFDERRDIIVDARVQP